jgi:hypothetical protein
MRHSIDTAPKDGKFVIIVDDASGRFDVVQWLTASQGWVRENGEPSDVHASHWNPISNEQYELLVEKEASDCSPAEGPLSTVSTPSIAPTPVTQDLVAPVSVLTVSPAVGTPDEAEPPVITPRSDGRRERRRSATLIAAGLIATVAAFGLYRQNEVAAFLTRYQDLPNAIGEKLQFASRELRLPGLLASDERLASLTNELAETRRTMDATNLRLQVEVTKAQSLEQERDRTAALLQESTATRQQLAASVEQARSALATEQARVVALTNELATASRDLASKTAELGRAEDDMKLLKQKADAEAAELGQSLQQEREKATALARDLDTTRRELEARSESDRSTSSQGIQTKPVTDIAVAQPQEEQGSPEATKLVARAKALLARGDIGAARIVLERAVEAGSARASFALAETYDPNILASWGTYGTRGDPSKAQELYAKASAGGVREAKNRINALRQ